MKKIIGTVVALLTSVLLVYGISWLITCGIIKLITICFKLQFNWMTATGIWLILCLVGSFVKSSKSK